MSLHMVKLRWFVMVLRVECSSVQAFPQRSQ
jgi:hypothetical protein